MTSSFQPLQAKKAEVRFRQKIAQQHIHDTVLIPQEYNKKEMDTILQEKTQRTIKDFRNLKNKHIPMSPFLEIGTGYGQASLVLRNIFHCNGYAGDIAIDPLTCMPTVAKDMKFQHMPRRIICDAEHLPFLDNSVPFIFCYQTLHHFPNPSQVMKEAERVLAPGGVFFFSEEPVAQKLNFSLWRRPTKLRAWEKVLKTFLVLHFISRIGKSETDEGILEETFSLQTWKEALDIFEEVTASIDPFPIGIQGNMIKRKGTWKKRTFKDVMNRYMIYVLGGGIRGICVKKGTYHTLKSPALACPDCVVALHKARNMLHCPSCKQTYVKNNHIWMLLPQEIKSKLYPI